MKLRRLITLSMMGLLLLSIGSISTGCGRTHTYWGVESENYYGDDGYKHDKKHHKHKKDKKHKKHKDKHHHD